MLVSSVPLFSFICKISNSLGSLLVTWNNDLRSFTLIGNESADSQAFKQRHDSLKKRNYLHTAAVAIVILQCILGRNASVFIKAQEVIAIGIMQCLTCHLHTCREKADELVLYINGHFQFHNIYCHHENIRNAGGKVPESTTLTERLNKLFAQVFAATGLTFPTAVFGVHWMFPCRASLPGYWLLNECSSDAKDNMMYGYASATTGILVKLLVFLFSQWIWQFGVNASVFVNSGLSALGTMGIRSYIETYFNLYKSNTLSINQKIGAFRHIQVLVTLANSISQESALPSLIIAGVSTMSTGLAMLIRIPLSSDTIFFIFIYACGTVNGFMIITVCLGGMVSVYRKCNELMHEAKRMQYYQCQKNKFDGKLLKRFWKSCPVTKIKFGSSNYVDEMTPLNSLNFSINLTVQFLLVRG